MRRGAGSELSIFKTLGLRRFGAARGRFEPGLGRRRREHCPLCETLVGVDDAVGIIGDRIAHAECALVSWLEADPSSLQPSRRGTRWSRSFSATRQRQLRTLLATLLNDHTPT